MTDIAAIAAGLSSKFWARVDKTGSCWEWSGKLTRQGYGYVSHARKVLRAHRVSLELHGREIPEGLVVDHICRNRKCVNPDHLRVVTNKENVLCGVGVTAIFARRTHCRNGHELSGDNVAEHGIKHGYRICRQCINDRKDRDREKAKQERSAKEPLQVGDVVMANVGQESGYAYRAKVEAISDGKALIRPVEPTLPRRRPLSTGPSRPSTKPRWVKAMWLHPVRAYLEGERK